MDVGTCRKQRSCLSPQTNFLSVILEIIDLTNQNPENPSIYADFLNILSLKNTKNCEKWAIFEIWLVKSIILAILLGKYI